MAIISNAIREVENITYMFAVWNLIIRDFHVYHRQWPASFMVSRNGAQ